MKEVLQSKEKDTGEDKKKKAKDTGEDKKKESSDRESNTGPFELQSNALPLSYHCNIQLRKINYNTFETIVSYQNV